MVAADHDRDGRADLVIATGCPGSPGQHHGSTRMATARAFWLHHITEAYRDFYPQRDER